MSEKAEKLLQIIIFSRAYLMQGYEDFIQDDVRLKRKSTATVNLKTGRFATINSAVIISSVSKAVQN